MALLGMELSDVGIMVAGGDPASLLDVDGRSKESPGFALTENDRLLFGKDAQRRARLNPRLYTNAFWDEVSTEPLKHPGFEGRSNAELAYHHLSRIWDAVKRHGNEVIIGVPGFLTQGQLGLILGIAKELSMPVKGFAATAIGASAKPYPDHLLFHLDIHQHRIEITFLEQGDHLFKKDTETVSGKGISYLYAEWAKAIADEFVRTTRFDPFDQAVYEQELYSRLPRLLRELQVDSSIMFEMKAGSQIYSITLTYDLLAKKGRKVFHTVAQLIKAMAERYGVSDTPLALEITHRVSPLAGCKEAISNIANTQIIELEPGACALGVLDFKNRFVMQGTSEGVTFLSSRPWQTSLLSHAPTFRDPSSPTHVLYGDVAYPISYKPLIIGKGTEKDVTISILDHVTGVSRKHCTIQISNNDVLLVDHSESGTYVDGIKVSGTAVLRLGQKIRIGTPAQDLSVITCVQTDET